jgi:hypothetical protein
MALLNLYNVIDLKMLVAGAGSNDKFTIPGFFQGESPSVNLWLLTPSQGGGFGSPWTIVLPGSCSVRMGLYDSTGAQLAFASVWAADPTNRFLVGTLTYNSANITTALGVASPAPCTFEIEVTDATGAISKSYQAASTMTRQWIPAGAAQVPPGEVAAVQSWVSGNFCKRVGLPGEQNILVSPNGSRFVFAITDDGTPTYTRL